ncbi:nuclear transport factor 2 family protein [uncultured Cellulomonas sp.]|uniref:nuclear transport factor 2 family protein n=1 Tax=uncultured Cellulomonas sp. TaxID=189682 RepID=UPI002626AD8D|nr:nuclear transport factor 2 family protein [uncultured Cellulomonas sp.]
MSGGAAPPTPGAGPAGPSAGPQDDPVALERAGWRALTSGADAATAHYDAVLADRVVMLLPGGTVLTDRAQVVASMGGPAWDWYDLEDLAVLEPAPGTALVHYGGRARRGEHTYSALFASLYVRTDDGWRMASHQQTPR